MSCILNRPGNHGIHIHVVIRIQCVHYFFVYFVKECFISSDSLVIDYKKDQILNTCDGLPIGL